LQWYEYVPALVNVKEYDEPVGRSGDVHMSALPESAVQVCVVESLFVTVTFVPAFTFSGVGLNAKLSMVIAEPLVPEVCAAGTPAAVVFGLELP
jgi:hypothetical protein